MVDAVRILLLADSHLGFDLPLRPRVQRRRRGHDFFANYAAALKPAFDGEVDIVVHAGDVFDRPDVHASVAYQAYQQLRRIADRGVPVFVVPGNHERSRMPHAHLLTHPGVHVFTEPRTFVAEVRGRRIALAGFPYERHDVRTSFPALLAQTRWHDADAPLRILCMHHCVEGATVGPANYTFTTAADVVRLRDVPSHMGAVLSGHIHRHQVLTRDLSGRRLAAPVLYPGSVERTAVAEIGEPKGYMLVHIGANDAPEARWSFRELPTRPMIRAELHADGKEEQALAAAVDDVIAAAPPDAVLCIRVSGDLSPSQWRALSAARLRAVAPSSMNVEISNQGARRPAMASSTENAPPPPISRATFAASSVNGYS